jgi:hypothetical protein
LRDLIAKKPSEEFRGVYLEGGVHPTRKNVLVPGALGVYTGGGSYNPAQMVRTAEVAPRTSKLDKLLEEIGDKTYVAMPMEAIQALIKQTMPDESLAERVWDPMAMAGSMGQYATLRKENIGYVYVDRDRDLQESRRETQGVLSGGEAGAVPDDKLTLFLLRTKAKGKQHAAWWPQVRFPSGRYAFAFSI